MFFRLSSGTGAERMLGRGDAQVICLTLGPPRWHY